MPLVAIDRKQYAIVVPLLAAIPKAALTKPIASLAAHRTEIVAAIDLVVTGA